jgi:hypothetical protein
MAVLEPHAGDPDGPDTGADRLHVLLEPGEIDVLTALASGLAARLRGAPSEDDGLLRRLTPRSSHADEDVDRELRAMLSADLHADRAQRLDDLLALLRSGHVDANGPHVRIVLDRAGAERVVQSLNDLRIGLAATVGLDRTPREELAPDDPRQETMRLVDALAWLQGGLIEFVDVGQG